MNKYNKFLNKVVRVTQIKHSQADKNKSYQVVHVGKLLKISPRLIYLSTGTQMLKIYKNSIKKISE